MQKIMGILKYGTRDTHPQNTQAFQEGGTCFKSLRLERRSL
jgi:hypothetical protein